MGEKSQHQGKRSCAHVIFLSKSGGLSTSSSFSSRGSGNTPMLHEPRIQEELGKRVGFSRQAINALESEKHDPSLDLAYRIASSFQVPVDQIDDSKTQETRRIWKPAKNPARLLGSMRPFFTVKPAASRTWTTL